MAKFYYYRDEGSDGIYWKGQYHYTVKEARDEALNDGMPQPFKIFEVKVTDTEATLKNLLNKAGGFRLQVLGEPTLGNVPRTTALNIMIVMPASLFNIPAILCVLYVRPQSRNRSVLEH